MGSIQLHFLHLSKDKSKLIEPKYSRMSILKREKHTYLSNGITSTFRMSQYNISGLRVNHEDIVDQHLAQDYGELRSGVMIDKLRAQYQIFPNEALYIIDCKHAQLEPLTTNFDRITGFPGPHKNELATLYTHVSELNYEALVRWVRTMLNGIFREWDHLQAKKDILRCMYLGHDGRVIMKSTTPLIFDNKKTMRYSLGKLTDMTDIVPFQYFTYRFDGPNRDTVLNTYNRRIQQINVLSKRETEILQLIGAGKSSEEIAARLFISRLTVDKHRRNIIEKIGTATAKEAFLKCKNSGYF